MTVSRQVVEGVFREESGRILAHLISVVRDFDLADDALQDAFTRALERWPSDGLPDNPSGWIARTARNSLIDTLRRRKTARFVPLPEELAVSNEDDLDVDV